MPARDIIPGREPCPYGGGRGNAQFQAELFRYLVPDGHQLIVDWARRAHETLTRASLGDSNSMESLQRSRYSFESFIYAWISFNGWASCCCGADRDRKLLNTLRSDPSVSAEFDSLVQADPTVAQAVAQFGGLWPIFRASQVKPGQETAVREHLHGGRDAVVAYYTHAFPDAERAPNCHLLHEQGQIKPDWAHTLEALYRVRNNLFHGTKSSHANVDREVIDAAAAVLVPVVRHMLFATFD